MTDFYTYLHCKPNGDPFYVGKGHGRRSHRFDKRNQHHKNIVAKYGAENILVYVTKRDSEESALKAEIRLIKMLRWAGFELCNQTDGGEGTSGRKEKPESRAKQLAAKEGFKHSAETRAKMSAVRVGIKLSAEARANMSAAKIGKPSNKAGKLASPETKAKQSAAAKNRSYRMTQEERFARASKAAKVRWASKQEYGVRNSDGAFCHKPEKDGIVAHSDNLNVQL